MLNNLSSKYILNIIFQNVRSKKRLNIIKYNKKIIARLDIKKEDFKAYEVLKKFNSKYKINIEDIDIDELILNRYQNLGGEVFLYLKKIHFKELRVLNLYDNHIENIDALEKTNFNNLTILDLGYNNIESIDILEKVNLKNLKCLYLNRNEYMR